MGNLFPSVHCTHNESQKSKMMRKKTMSTCMLALWTSPCIKSLASPTKLSMSLSEINHETTGTSIFISNLKLRENHLHF